MVKRFVIVMLAVLTLGLQAFAQNAVSGKVTDAKGEAIPGVSVLIKGTTTGTMTDLDGSYRLNVRPGATLVFSCVGFQDQEVVPGSRTVVNVALAEDTEMLDELVYVAYGTAKKKDLTGSISTIDEKNIVVQAQGSVTRALEGQVAGLQTTIVDGQPVWIWVSVSVVSVPLAQTTPTPLSSSMASLPSRAPTSSLRSTGTISRASPS